MGLSRDALAIDAGCQCVLPAAACCVFGYGETDDRLMAAGSCMWANVVGESVPPMDKRFCRLRRWATCGGGGTTKASA